MSVDPEGRQPERAGTGSPRTRASDAEREAVVERLREATAEGRLTLEELADRTEAAYLARYRDDLDRIAADLPQPQPQPHPQSPTGARPGDPGQGPDVFRATIGDRTYDRPALGPSGEVEATAVLGDLTLNLAHAQAPPTGELRIVARAWGGDVKLIVPEGVLVELSGSVSDRTRTTLDRFRDRLDGPAEGPDRDMPPGAPRVRIEGSAFLGEVTVAHPRGSRRTTWREWIDVALDRTPSRR